MNTIILSLTISLVYLVFKNIVISENKLLLKIDFSRHILINILIIIILFLSVDNYFLIFVFFLLINSTEILFKYFHLKPNPNKKIQDSISMKIFLNPIIKTILTILLIYIIGIFSLNSSAIIIYITIIVLDLYMYIKECRNVSRINFDNLCLLSTHHSTLNNFIHANVDRNIQSTLKIYFYNNNSINAHLFYPQKNVYDVILTSKSIEVLSESEILALIHHEIGHIKGKHQPIRFLLRIINNLLLIGIAYLIILYCILTANNIIVGVCVSILALDIYMLINSLITNFILRKQEYLADQYSIEKKSNKYLISALDKIKKNNKQKEIKGISFYLKSRHPKIEKRILKLQRSI